MTDQPDDIRWIPESQMLEFCRLSRSTFKSWSKSGLEIATENGAYGLSALVSLVLLRAAREFLSPKKMVGAWSRLESEGAIGPLVAAARKLEKGGRFDLVVDPEYSELEVVFGDEELIAAVRTPGWARSVVVVDVAEPVRRMVRAFDINANRTARPKERAPGRPRRPERGTLHRIDEKASA
jgi:hypothetical protein